MKNEIEKWTQHYLGMNFNLIEAREKAINKVRFIHEVNRINPAMNKPLKGLYS